MSYISGFKSMIHMMNVAAYAIHFEHLEGSFEEQPFLLTPNHKLLTTWSLSLKLDSAKMANIQTKYESNPVALVIL